MYRLNDAEQAILTTLISDNGLIGIAADRNYRRHSTKLLQHRDIADVTRVQYQLRTRQGGHRLGPKQPMGVGDYANPRSVFRLSFFVFRDPGGSHGYRVLP